MKFIVGLALCIAVTVAAPPNSADFQATIVNQQKDIDLQGNYQYAVKTSNGIDAQEQGNLKQVPGAETQSIAVRGSFSFISTDGLTYTVDYVADENGYQPQAAHLPVSPVA